MLIESNKLKPLIVYSLSSEVRDNTKQLSSLGLNSVKPIQNHSRISMIHLYSPVEQFSSTSGFLFSIFSNCIFLLRYRFNFYLKCFKIEYTLKAEKPDDLWILKNELKSEILQLIAFPVFDCLFWICILNFVV